MVEKAIVNEMFISILTASALTWLVVLWQWQSVTWLSVSAFVIVHSIGAILALIYAIRRGGEGVAKDFDHHKYIADAIDIARIELDLADSGRSALKIQWNDALGNCLEVTVAESPTDIALTKSILHGGRATVPLGRVHAEDVLRSRFLVTTGGQSRLLSCRFLPLKTVHNMRDLGGYETGDGSRIAWGKLYRSGQWSDIDVEDFRLLIENVGVKTVVDLRNDHERKAGKSVGRLLEESRRSGGDLRNIEICVEGKIGLRDLYDIFSRILFRRAELATALGQYYIDLVKNGAKQWAAFVEVFADEGNLPAAFFCKSGKDRTGIGASMVLSLLGVQEDVIIKEYCLTNLDFDRAYDSFRRSNVFRSLGVADEDLRQILVADPQWLRSLYAFINETYGSLEEYLIKEGGMRPDTRDRLRANLLAPLE